MNAPSTSDNDLKDLAAILRSNLSATELVLAKFTEALRRKAAVVLREAKRTDATEQTREFSENLRQVQSDFGKLKDKVDLLLTYFI